MQNKTKSWFNETRLKLATEGVVINDKKHIFSPVFKGKVCAQRVCPECGSKNAFIFRSHTDGQFYLAVCFKCKAEVVRQVVAKGQAPVPGTACKCGGALPIDRKMYCYTCRPPKKAPLF